MIAQGKERGFVTYDELNAALPPDQVSSEQIEDTMSMLSEAGINVVENEDNDDNGGKPEKEQETSSGNADENEIGRSDDPVRMYLREMGSVESPLPRGRNRVAKRIEAGREMMIGGIVDSPMTIRALLQWRDALDEEPALLRDIIDLDATYSGPRVEDATAGGIGLMDCRSLAHRRRHTKTLRSGLKRKKSKRARLPMAGMMMRASPRTTMKKTMTRTMMMKILSPSGHGAGASARCAQQV